MVASQVTELLLRAIDPSCLSESPIRVLDWGDRDKAGEMFCGEVGLFFWCDDGGEMSWGDGLMLGAGPSRGWWRETTRGKPGGRCGLLRDACLPAARKAAVYWCIF